MLHLNKSFKQAVALVLFLDKKRDQVSPANESAEYLNISVDSVLKILQALARHGVISSSLGRGGGYKIIRPLSQITVTELWGVFCGVQIPYTDYVTSASEAERVMQVFDDELNSRVKVIFDNLTMQDWKNNLAESLGVVN